MNGKPCCPFSCFYIFRRMNQPFQHAGDSTKKSCFFFHAYFLSEFVFEKLLFFACLQAVTIVYVLCRCVIIIAIAALCASAIATIIRIPDYRPAYSCLSAPLIGNIRCLLAVTSVLHSPYKTYTFSPCYALSKS